MNKFISLVNKFIIFHDYFQKKCVECLGGMLKHNLLGKYVRSNSHIQYYNKIIKLKLSNYLYGKNHCKISWLLFIYFMKNKKEAYRLPYPYLENDIIQNKNFSMDVK